MRFFLVFEIIIQFQLKSLNDKKTLLFISGYTNVFFLLFSLSHYITPMYNKNEVIFNWQYSINEYELPNNNDCLIAQQQQQKIYPKKAKLCQYCLYKFFHKILTCRETDIKLNFCVIPFMVMKLNFCL